jgi:hypothetical protein
MLLRDLEGKRARRPYFRGSLYIKQVKNVWLYFEEGKEGPQGTVNGKLLEALDWETKAISVNLPEDFFICG